MLIDPFAMVPAEWTAVRLASKRGRTKFVCELARQAADDDAEYQPSALAGALDDEFIVIGKGDSPEAAVADALSRAMHVRP